MGGTQRLAERAGPAAPTSSCSPASCTTPRRSSAGTSSTASSPTTASTRPRATARRGSPRARRAPSGDEGDRRARRSRAASRAAERACPTSPGDLFATQDLKSAVRSFLTEVPARRPTRAAERGLAPGVSGGRSRHDPAHGGLPGSSRRAPRPQWRAVPSRSGSPPPRPRPTRPRRRWSRTPRMLSPARPTSPARSWGWPPTAGCGSR